MIEANRSDKIKEQFDIWVEGGITFFEFASYVTNLVTQKDIDEYGDTISDPNVIEFEMATLEEIQAEDKD